MIALLTIIAGSYMGLGLIYAALLFGGVLDGHRRPVNLSFIYCAAVWPFALWWLVWSACNDDEANKLIIDMVHPDLVIEDTPEARTNMDGVLEANVRTRLLGLWDEHKALLEEYEELRESMFPEGGIVFFDAGTVDIDFADGDEGEVDGEVAA